MNIPFLSHSSMRNGKTTVCNKISHKVYNLFFFQSLMEKYPDVEVRVFRGGESVGENIVIIWLLVFKFLLLN